MIRIHAGKYKNSRINRVLVETTRETASMVREAVFNMLYQVSGNCLDLFAGAGSYGITALSLGASNCTFVDNNKLAIKTIKDNLSKLKIIDAEIYFGSYDKYLDMTKEKFDFIFLDPPYDFKNYLEILNLVANVATDNATIILEVNKNTDDIFEFNNFKLIKNKIYGIKKVLIYSNNG